MSIVAQRTLGGKTLTKTFTNMAWSLLGNDKGGWVRIEQSVDDETKVLQSPPTGDKVKFNTNENNSPVGEQKVGNEAEKENTGSEAATLKDNLSEKASSANGTSVNEQHNAGQKVTEDRAINYETSASAIKAMNTFTSIEDVKAFIAGEDRAKVLNAAKKIIGE